MRFCRVAILAGTLAQAIVAMTQAAIARSLQPYEVYEKRKASVVIFQHRSKDQLMGYGVVVSRQGHVLTANHVITDFNAEPISGWLGEKGTPDALLEFDPAVSIPFSDPSFDLRLVKLRKPPAGLTPAPIGSGAELKVNTTRVQILTGYIDQNDPASLDAGVTQKLNGRSDFYRLQSNGLNRGHSGSPVFDAYGDVIGFIPSGFQSTGLADLRTFLLVADWLRAQNVSVEPRTLQDKFAVLVRAEGQEDLRGEYQAKLVDWIGDIFGLEPADADPPFVGYLTAMLELRDDQVLNDVVDRHGKEWYAQQDAGRIILYVVNLQFKTGAGIPALHSLFALEPEGGKIKATQWVLDRVPLDRIPEKNDPGWSTVVAANSIKLLKKAIEKQGAPLHENTIVFANCLNMERIVEAPDRERIEWRPLAALKLKGALKQTDMKKYRIESDTLGACRRDKQLFSSDNRDKQRFPDDSDQYPYKKELAHLSIKPFAERINQDMLEITWSVLRPRPFLEVLPRSQSPIKVPLTGDEFASLLAKRIDEDWPQVLGQLKP
jgi:hypothetical protein